MLALRFLGAVLSVLFVTVISGLALLALNPTVLIWIGVLALLGVGFWTVARFTAEPPYRPAVDYDVGDRRHWNPGL